MKTIYLSHLISSFKFQFPGMEKDNYGAMQTAIKNGEYFSEVTNTEGVYPKINL